MRARAHPQRRKRNQMASRRRARTGAAQGQRADGSRRRRGACGEPTPLRRRSDEAIKELIHLKLPTTTLKCALVTH